MSSNTILMSSNTVLMSSNAVLMSSNTIPAGQSHAYLFFWTDLIFPAALNHLHPAVIGQEV